MWGGFIAFGACSYLGMRWLFRGLRNDTLDAQGMPVTSRTSFIFGGIFLSCPSSDLRCLRGSRDCSIPETMRRMLTPCDSTLRKLPQQKVLTLAPKTTRRRGHSFQGRGRDKQ